MRRCDAVVIIHDTRWAAFVHRCQLELDHDGEHIVELNACVPPAQLRWAEPSLVEAET
jgi:hypothetical protein